MSHRFKPHWIATSTNAAVSVALCVDDFVTESFPWVLYSCSPKYRLSLNTKKKKKRERRKEKRKKTAATSLQRTALGTDAGCVWRDTGVEGESRAATCSGGFFELGL